MDYDKFLTGIRTNTFIVDLLGVQHVFVGSSIGSRNYHGVIDGINVLVDWINRPNVTIYTPNRQHTGYARDMGKLSMVIRDHLLDVLNVPGIVRAKYCYPFTYTATPTGFLLLYKEIYIIRFEDNSGWMYATDNDLDDIDVDYSVAFTNDVIPSAEHCISVFTQGEFYA